MIDRILLPDSVRRMVTQGAQLLRVPVAMLLALLLVACSGESSGPGGTSANASNAGNGPVLDVYLTRTCGCCGGWVEHSQAEGFDSIRNYLEQGELNQVKAEHGIGPRLQSCHTAVSEDGYVFEGHIPANVIHDFLQSPPEGAIGLAVPGMPIGSPGMEMGERFTPYDVLLVAEDGSTEVYTHIAQADQQYTN